MPTLASHCPELLAPAGGPSALHAAIANGADAVYLGVETFNARRSAENFTLASLSEACSFAHLRDRKVYLTANVVILQEEMGDALSLVDNAWAAGVDAVIVQDLGLLRAIRGQLPHVRIHCSTQINAHNRPTVQALAELGVRRVTLAREVSIEEVASLSDASVEIETFVHGALCVCYSGQCLMSSLIGRRSANRGMCAQPCRLPYELIGPEGKALETPGLHLLSPKDLAGVTVLEQLICTGVAALKIEGRMKSAEYVALVTRVYRDAIDRAIRAPSAYIARDGELSVLAESFSRGFTEAYLLGEHGNAMMSYRRPNNRGVLVGRVAAVSGRQAEVLLDSPLDADDTLEFWTRAGRFAQIAGAMSLEGTSRPSAPAGAKVKIGVSQPLSAGDRVFRVRNSALSAAAARTFANIDAIAPIELRFSVRVVVGQALCVEVTDEAGRAGRARGPVVESARTKAITAEEITEHVGRLGGTPYRISRFDLELSPDVGLGFSALHRARREALSSYEAVALSPWSSRPVVSPRVHEPQAFARSDRVPLVVASVADEDSAMACLAQGADMACVPASSLGFPRSLAAGVVPVLPRICHDREVIAALLWASADRRVIAGNLGLVVEASRRGARVDADWALNVLNAQSVALLKELGASFVWLSPELSGLQIAGLIAKSPLPAGIAVFGRQELMVTEHCVLMAQGPCGQRCDACVRRQGPHSLRDRLGYEFPVRTDEQGRSHIYNAMTLDLTSSLPEILDAGASAIRVDVLLDNKAAAASAVTRVRDALDRAVVGVRSKKSEKSAAKTSGHFYRGVL